ncbi:MAG: DUF3187 family protein [Planctomycetes bacterium]|nr:DUF3187 family protein [Planctomycetota bacterium]
MKHAIFVANILLIISACYGVSFSQDFLPQPLEEPGSKRDLTFQDIWKAFGPAQIRNQSALKVAALEWLPDNPETIPVGTYRTDFAITHANHWGDMPEYLIDGETTRMELRFALGVRDDLEFELAYAGFWRGGGIFDGIIENFHDFFRITQSRRNNYPRNKLAFLLDPKDPDTRYIITDNSAGFGAGDILLKLKYQIIESRFNYRPAMTFSVITKVPVGNADDYFTVRAFEFCGHLTIRQRITHRAFIYTAIGLTYTNADKIWEVEIRPTRWFWFIGLEWRIAYHWTLNLQYEWESGIARPKEYEKMLSWSTNLVTFAIQWRPEIDRDYFIEFATNENTLFHSNTPDIAFHVAIKYFFN